MGYPSTPGKKNMVIFPAYKKFNITLIVINQINQQLSYNGVPKNKVYGLHADTMKLYSATELKAMKYKNVLHLN